MEWLNYHHLYYFWIIQQEGGLVFAAKRLRLTHSTLSAQLRSLEDFLGGQLFERRGRRLVLTPLGGEMATYASEIFRMGSELVDVARGRSVGLRSKLAIGVVGTLPRSIAYRLLAPALALDEQAPIVVRQDSLPRLVEELANGRLQLVLADEPPAPTPFRLHVHPLGSSEILLYGKRSLAARYRKGFPARLSGAPVLVPSSGSLRRALDGWFADQGIAVTIAGEFDDAGMLRSFGGNGVGLFPVRAALRTEVEEAHGAVCLGALSGIEERYYAISVERRIRHRGVAAIVDQARASLSDHAEPARKVKAKRAKLGRA